MSLPMTNEQKLDAIYALMQKQESRESRAFWYNLLKRVIIYGAIIFVALNPTVILGYMTDLIMPRVMETMSQALDQQKTDAVGGITDAKDTLIQKIRDLVPAETAPSEY